MNGVPGMLSTRGVGLLLGAQVLLALAAIRHQRFWGAGPGPLGVDVATWLHLMQAGALIFYTVMTARFLAVVATGPHPAQTRWIGGLLVLAAILTPPLLSSDVFDNLARGRVEAIHGANPYLVPPTTFVDDPSLERAQWPSVVMLYGPLTALAQTTIAWLVGEHLWLGIYLFKILFGLCHVATAFCLRAALRKAAPAVAEASFWMWLCHPFLLLESAGAAHNDAQMAMFLSIMVLALTKDSFLVATLAFGLAVLTKHGCAVLGPLLLVLAIRRGRVLPFTAGVIASLAVAAPLALHYFAVEGGLDWLLRPVGHSGTSLQHFAASLLGLDRGLLVTSGYTITCVALVLCATRVRDNASFGLASITLLLVFLTFGMPLFSPWYHLWWFPLLGLTQAQAPRRVFAALAVLGPLSYLVHQATRTFGLSHQVWQWLLALALPLLLVVFPRQSRS